MRVRKEREKEVNRETKLEKAEGNKTDPYIRKSNFTCVSIREPCLFFRMKPPNVDSVKRLCNAQGKKRQHLEGSEVTE